MKCCGLIKQALLSHSAMSYEQLAYSMSSIGLLNTLHIIIYVCT